MYMQDETSRQVPASILIPQGEIIFSPNLDIENSLETATSKIHIRIKQRNTRKSTTHVENLPINLNLTSLLKKMKIIFGCNGSIQEVDGNKFIQLFGDQRLTVKNYLISNSIVDENNIVIHGY